MLADTFQVSLVFVHGRSMDKGKGTRKVFQEIQAGLSPSLETFSCKCEGSALLVPPKSISVHSDICVISEMALLNVQLKRKLITVICLLKEKILKKFLRDTLCGMVLHSADLLF